MPISSPYIIQHKVNQNTFRIGTSSCVVSFSSKTIIFSDKLIFHIVYSLTDIIYLLSLLASKFDDVGQIYIQTPHHSHNLKPWTMKLHIYNIIALLTFFTLCIWNILSPTHFSHCINPSFPRPSSLTLSSTVLWLSSWNTATGLGEGMFNGVALPPPLELTTF